VVRGDVAEPAARGADLPSTCVTGVLSGKKAGWKSFDPVSKTCGAEEVRKERQPYGEARR